MTAAAKPASTPSRPLTRVAKRASGVDLDTPAANPSSPSAPAPPPAKRTRRAATMPAMPAPVAEEPAATDEEPAVELPPASAPAPAATHSANNKANDDEEVSDLSDFEVFEARVSKLELHGSPTKPTTAKAAGTATPARATRSQAAAAAAAAAVAAVAANHADSTPSSRASPSPAPLTPAGRPRRLAAPRKPDATPSATAASKPAKGRKQPKPKQPAAAKSKPRPPMSPVKSTAAGTPGTAANGVPHPATPSPGPGKRKLDDRVQTLLEEAQARARDLDADLDAATAQLAASRTRETALQAELDRVKREMQFARDHDRGARHRVHQLEVDLAAEREAAAALRKKAETLETQLLKAEAARAADVKVRGAYQIDLSPTKVSQAMDELGLRMPVVVRAIMKEQSRDVQAKVDEVVVAELRAKANEELPQFTLSKSQRDKYLGGVLYRVLMAQFASNANPVTAQVHALANAFQTLFTAAEGGAQTAMQTAWDRSRAAVERHWAQVAMVPDLHAQPSWAGFYETVIAALRAALELRHVQVSEQLVADKLVPLVRNAARLWYLTQAVDSEWVIAFPDDVARINADRIKADNAARLVDGEAADGPGRSVFVLFATAPMIVIGKEQDAPLVFKAEGVRLDVPDPDAVAAAAAAAADEEVEAPAAAPLNGLAEPASAPRHAAGGSAHAPDPLEDPMPTPPPVALLDDDDDDNLEIMPIGATSSAATPADAHPSSPLVDVDMTMDDLPVDRPSSAMSGSQPFFTAPSAVGDLDVEEDDQDVDMAGGAGPAQPSAANLFAQLGANAMVVADTAAAPAPASGLASVVVPAPGSARAPVPAALAVAEGRAFDAVLHEMIGPVAAAQAAAAAAAAPAPVGSVDAEMDDVEMSEAEPLPTAPPS